MTDKREQHLNIDEVMDELQHLKEENYFLRKQNNALKMRCSKYCLEVRKLEEEVTDLRFTRKYLTSEEAGKRFAEELLGGA